MSLEKMFPKTIFVKNATVPYQLDVVLGELAEVEEGWIDGTNAEEEVVDVMHSAMQLFYILGTPREKVQDLVNQVYEKNDARGYYVKD